jgi:hypothetical protein
MSPTGCAPYVSDPRVVTKCPLPVRRPQWKPLNMTTSVSLSRARIIAIFLPSRDQAYAMMLDGLASMFVNWMGGPPARGCV